jgi:hypothetical protein
VPRHVLTRIDPGHRSRYRDRYARGRPNNDGYDHTLATLSSPARQRLFWISRTALTELCQMKNGCSTGQSCDQRANLLISEALRPQDCHNPGILRKTLSPRIRIYGLFPSKSSGCTFSCGVTLHDRSMVWPILLSVTLILGTIFAYQHTRKRLIHRQGDRLR